MNRNKLIDNLRMLLPGIDSSGSTVAQSDCIVFRDNIAYTFNDLVAVQSKMEFPYNGAVDANKLIQALSAMDGDDVSVSEDSGTLVIYSGKRKCRIKTPDSVELPIDSLYLPDTFNEVGAKFTEALATAATVTSKDANKYTMWCIHIHPDFVEASDNVQLLKWEVTTGVETPVLVPGHAASRLAKYAITEVGITDRWMHFRDISGLVYSVRTHDDKYMDMSGFYDVDGSEVVFPADMAEVASRASGFLDNAREDGVKVHLTNGTIRVEGHGNIAQYQEKAFVDYDGPAISFYVNPIVCKNLAKNVSTTVVSKDSIKVVTEDYTYVAVLMEAEEETSNG